MSTDVPDLGESIPDLVAASLDGDTAAWQRLVKRLERVVWKSVNMMTTDGEVRKDAFAATWLKLVERLDTIREPEKLPGWLATTATNEVRQIVRQRNRRDLHLDWSAPSTIEVGLAGGTSVDDSARNLVRSEAQAAVRLAFSTLDDDCRQLLTVLVLSDPPMSYKEASDALGRPIGSLGPQRQRCLDKLRATPAMREWVADES